MKANKFHLPCSPESGLSPDFILKYGLTTREAELGGVLLQGKSDQEIAALSGITVNTVKTHLRIIYRKTGVKGRGALMALANRMSREQ
jgi:DNA-binding CsgD family transcriptional regulator